MDAPESCQLPDDITYEQWVRYVFDHPVLDPRWWWQEPESGHQLEWNELHNPARTLAFLTELFEGPSDLIPRFTRAQIDQGLNFLVDNSCSSHMRVLSDTKLPWPARRRCIEAMTSLYENLMAPVYGHDLAHASDGDPDRPNYACFMWWDVIPLNGHMPTERRPINNAVLEVFEAVLQLKAEACLESVLHGLSHWHMYVPSRTQPLVCEFLLRRDLSPELRAYAECAAEGQLP